MAPLSLSPIAVVEDESNDDELLLKNLRSKRMHQEAELLKDLEAELLQEYSVLAQQREKLKKLEVCTTHALYHIIRVVLKIREILTAFSAITMMIIAAMRIHRLNRRN